MNIVQLSRGTCDYDHLSRHSGPVGRAGELLDRRYSLETWGELAAKRGNSLFRNIRHFDNR